MIDADIYEGQVAIVSEYVPDGSLGGWLKQHGGKAASIESACEIIEGVLAGLAHLHERRIIHRDLKPENILLQRDTPRVADFGIARLLRSGSYSTNISGTLAYMAPEAFDGKRNERTDIWATGVIFYQLLSGRLPYEQQDMASLVGALLRQDPAALGDAVPEVLRRVVMKALQRDPSQRYASAAEMRQELREAGRMLWLQKREAREAVPTLSKDPPVTLVLPKHQEARMPPTIAAPTHPELKAAETIKAQPPKLFNRDETRGEKTLTRGRNLWIGVAGIVIAAVALAGTFWILALDKTEQKKDGSKQSQANANKSTESKTPVSVSEQDIIAKEKATWDAIEKKDYDAYGNMLAVDYIEVEDDGLYDKTRTVNGVREETFSELKFSDWKLLPIDKDAFAITYTVSLKGTYKGQALPEGARRASSAWVNRDGRLLEIYHQETPVTVAPPPVSQSASKSAEAAVNPASNLSEAGADPVANEKLLWDALKNKNYDVFAAFLAPESIDVESEGIYDKAGSVKGASVSDFSAELSDWKTVTFDNDASLVTYAVKQPGANRELHSTIWVNRGGKWLVIFHQGTAAAAKP